MSGQAAAARNSVSNQIAGISRKMLLHPAYRFLLLLAGAPVTVIVFISYLFSKTNNGYNKLAEEMKQQLLSQGVMEKLLEEAKDQLTRKYAFFGQSVAADRLEREVTVLASKRFNEKLEQLMSEQAGDKGYKQVTFVSTLERLIENPIIFGLFFVIGFPMFILMGIYVNPFLKYIAERLFMTIFVIFGVAFLVFTILYISPMNPAANLLGETATAEQIAKFNQLYGLDQPYLTQLWNNVKGILTFDLGKAFTGNEQVTTAIANKFPVTLTLTTIATVISVLIALPIGIVSATRRNSFWDYTFMFIALIGLSIPNFWQGLIFILNFSIKLSWFPATYSPSNWMSAVMPIIVLGTTLTASVTRMTRSSTLEVIHEDYITTAKAKGLSRQVVLWKHAIGNALIPIVTVIGLQFGVMLGGAAVTEQVFNISGLGNYIVEKQFIPDIPAVMGGVVYTAITISLVNMIVDLLYAFFDPRIRSKMKQY